MTRPEFIWGEGKISGYLALMLAILGLGGVLCFHFPSQLTSPELRALYDVAWLRRILAASLALAFILSMISFFLSSKKILSLNAMLVVVVAVWLGGAGVELPDQVNAHRYWGLDWFILDLLILTLVFVPIERMCARRAEQRVLRTGWQTDLVHFFASHMLIQLTTFLIMAPALVASRWLMSESLQQGVSSQPAWLQFFEILLIADFMQYWVHRMFHQVPWLWKFHAVHHSTQEMDWLAGSRLHLFDIVVTRAIALVPIFCLGFSPSVLLQYLVFVAVWATFIHANFKYEFKWMHHMVVTPRFHHWHHAIEPEAIDKNFAVHLPWLDWMFGTYHLPAKTWPKGYGVHSEPVPESYWGQLLFPFSRKKK